MNADFQPVSPSARPALRADGHVGAGRFTLIQELGRGGMGVVWLARDNHLGEQVALKFLPPEVAADPVAVNDLRRETARSHRLTHPNIIRIHDFHQQADGVSFISMEYVDGPTLSAWRLAQPGQVCNWEDLAPLISQLCAALQYAHAEGVIHRDLKPANIMLDSKVRLKLADFGIAAVVSDSVSRVSARSSSGGTLAYMSPQQLRGQQPTVADDLYALGSSVYELLSGRPPFFRGDLTHQVLNEAAQPLAERLLETGMHNPVPGAVTAIVMACLAKEPAQRPQSAQDVAAWIGGSDQAPGLNEPASPPPVPSARNSKLGLWIGIAGGALLLCAFLGWIALRGQRKPSGQAAGGASGSSLGADGTAIPPSAQPPSAKGLPSQFVWVPPGTFVMGSPPSEDGHQTNEAPQTTVTLSRGFWISRFEATQADYQDVMGRNPSRYAGRLNSPVERVNWYDANDYCRRLDERERQAGRVPEGCVYRLPTEAEWEYAARAGTTTRFSYGDDPGYRDLPKHGWVKDAAAVTTHPVGNLQPNAWGLNDMSGNVWEWCLDTFGPHPGGQVTDPCHQGSEVGRVVRGGSIAHPGILARSACRLSIPASDRAHDFGFRVVVGPAPPSRSVSSQPTPAERPEVAKDSAALPPPAPSEGNSRSADAGSNAMIWVPAGAFQMGDALYDGKAQERPRHKVEVSGFFIEPTHVTGELWSNVLSWARSHSYDFRAGESKGAKHPVRYVTWHDVVKWCNARSEKEGLTPCYYMTASRTIIYRTGQTDISSDCVKWDANGYRLPTEAEWEKAARGGLEGKRFPWGETITHAQATYFSTNAVSYDTSPTRGFSQKYAAGGLPYTSPVGSFSPNGYGLFDMAGNLWEWCWDWQDTAWYGKPEASQADCRGPASGKFRVIRGGCWDTDANASRCSNRFGCGPENGFDRNIGFRCVRGSR